MLRRREPLRSGSASPRTPRGPGLPSPRNFPGKGNKSVSTPDFPEPVPLTPRLLQSGRRLREQSAPAAPARGLRLGVPGARRAQVGPPRRAPAPAPAPRTALWVARGRQVTANGGGRLSGARRIAAAGRAAGPPRRRPPSDCGLPAAAGSAPWTGRRRRRRRAARARARRAAGGLLGARAAPPPAPGSPAWRLWTGNWGPGPRPPARRLPGAPRQAEAGSARPPETPALSVLRPGPRTWRAWPPPGPEGPRGWQTVSGPLLLPRATASAAPARATNHSKLTGLPRFSVALPRAG